MIDVTDEDLRERFEIDAEGVIRWREVVPLGGQRFVQRAAARLNLMAGKPVKMRMLNGYPYTSLYNMHISEPRLRAILTGEPVQKAKQAATSGSKGGIKTSGLPQGVRVHRNRYMAQIYRDGAVRHLGMFGSLEEAVAARRQAEIEKEAR